MSAILTPPKPGAAVRVRSFIYGAVTTATVLVFALAEWWTAKVVTDLSRVASTAIEIALVLVAAIAFRPMHRWVEASLEAAFTRARREAREKLFRLRRDLASIDNSETLMQRVIAGIDRYMEAAGCAFYMRRQNYEPIASSFEFTPQSVELDDALAIRLRSTGAPAYPRQLHSSAAGSVAFPMIAGGELIGFISVAPKAGSYEPDDRQTLAALAEVAGFALALLEPAAIGGKGRGAARAGNLPTEIASLIGRETELAQIADLLASHRLVCLKGAGGIGKSRLALRAAHEYARAGGNPAWLVDCSSAASRDDVVSVLTAALAVPAAAGVTQMQNALDVLCNAPALLVFDNCEHLLSAAGAVVREILAGCSSLRVLLTSREPLMVAGEAVFNVPPLGAPASAALLYARAAEAGCTLQLPGSYGPSIEVLLRHLDGIPFAIELAAARLRIIAPSELAERIGDRFALLTGVDRAALPRQQTLRAMIDWSYGLLSADEQLLFKRLAVFPRDFGLDAAATICGTPPLSEADAVGLIGHLLDKSLLQPEAGSDGQRFRFLESTQAYAREVAGTTDREAMSLAHARYYARIAHERTDAGLRAEIGNIRAALEWSLRAAREPRLGGELAADAVPVFMRLSLFTEAIDYCRLALEVEGLPLEVRAHLYYGLSMLDNNRGRYKEALDSAQHAVELLRGTADERGLTRALSQVSQLHATQSQLPQALDAALQALDRARNADDPGLLGLALRRCAIAYAKADIEKTRELFRESAKIFRDLGDTAELARVLVWWAEIEAENESFERAKELGIEASPLVEGDLRMYLLNNLAQYHLAIEEYEEATAIVREGLALALEAAHPITVPSALLHAAIIAERLDAVAAAKLLGYARSALVAIECDLSIADEVSCNRAFRRLSRRFSADELSHLLTEGQRWSLDRAVEAARSI